MLQKFWWNVHDRTSRLYSVYICLIQPCNTDLWLMCIVWVCVYFYLLSPFSVLCSSYKRPHNFNNCLQFGKILMATSRICIVLCSLQGLQPDTLYFKAEWCFGPSTASYQLDDLGQDLWTLSSSSLQMGEQWQHPS